MLSQENKNNVCFNVIEMNKHVFFFVVFQKTIFFTFPLLQLIVPVPAQCLGNRGIPTLNAIPHSGVSFTVWWVVLLGLPPTHTPEPVLWVTCSSATDLCHWVKLLGLFKLPWLQSSTSPLDLVRTVWKHGRYLTERDMH